MPTNTPRSIAEALKELRQVAAAVGAPIETRRTRADETRWSAALTRIADELQALATANGAEGLPELPEAVPMGSDSDSVRDFTVYGYTADQMRAYALATRPQAASDGEDARNAARYRWLKSEGIVRVHPMETRPGSRILADGSCVPGNFTYVIDGKISDLDAAIDAAMTTDAAKGDDHG